VPETSEGLQSSLKGEIPPTCEGLEEPLPESFNKAKPGWESMGPSKAREISSGEREWRLKRASKMRRME